MTKKLKLFHFVDPDNGEVKYIGATKHSEVILNQYICASGKCGRPLCEWLSELKKEGKRPQVLIIKEIDKISDRSEYIENFGQKDRLLNVSKKGNQIYINAGKLSNKTKRVKKGKDCKPSMINSLIKFYKKTGRFPVSRLGESGWGSDAALCEKFKVTNIARHIRHFGSYKVACNLALRQITGDADAIYDSGIKPWSGKAPKYTKEQMLEFLIEYKNKNGEYPKADKKAKRWKDESFNLPSLSVANYRKNFGNIIKARSEADKLLELTNG